MWYASAVEGGAKNQEPLAGLAQSKANWKSPAKAASRRHTRVLEASNPKVEARFLKPGLCSGQHYCTHRFQLCIIIMCRGACCCPQITYYAVIQSPWHPIFGPAIL